MRLAPAKNQCPGSGPWRARLCCWIWHGPILPAEYGRNGSVGALYGNGYSRANPSYDLCTLGMAVGDLREQMIACVVQWSHDGLLHQPDGEGR